MLCYVSCVMWVVFLIIYSFGVQGIIFKIYFWGLRGGSLLSSKSIYSPLGIAAKKEQIHPFAWQSIHCQWKDGLCSKKRNVTPFIIRRMNLYFWLTKRIFPSLSYFIGLTHTLLLPMAPLCPSIVSTALW